MNPDISRWQTAPADAELDPHQLHLWRFRTDLAAPAVSSLYQTLSVDERDRADRFLGLDKQQQFVVARGYLRRILGRYVNCSPAAVVFLYSAQGRPAVAATRQEILDFNLSHSGSWGVVALCRSAVGVDVEQIKAKQNLQAMADYAFDDDEVRRFSSYSPARRQRGFYRIWTAKEARYKCPGKDLYIRSFPLAPGYLVTVAGAATPARISRFHLCWTSSA